MTRARLTLAATLVGASFVAAHAQTPAAPPMTSVLAGKKFTPPFKGQAEIDYTKPLTKNEKGMVTTTIMVKNNAPGPLLRLTIDETWYGREGWSRHRRQRRRQPPRSRRSGHGED